MTSSKSHQRYNYLFLQRGTLPLAPNKTYNSSCEHRCSSVLLWPENTRPVRHNTLLTDPCFTIKGFAYAKQQLKKIHLQFHQIGTFFVTHRHFDHIPSFPHKKECIDLREQLFKQMKRLTWLDEILDLYKIVGKDILASHENIQESAQSSDSAEATPDENIQKDTEKIAKSDLSEASPSSPLVDSITESDDCKSGFLCIVEGSRKGERIPLISMDLTLGASPDSDIQIDDNGVADDHAQIIYKDDKYYLQNIDLLGRSLVNGMQIKSCILKKGDMISLGNFKMQVEF